MYSLDDICNLINIIYDLKINKKDLELCKPQQVQTIYSLFLQDFGADISALKEIPLSATNLHQHTQVFAISFTLLNTTKCIQFFLRTISGNEDFTLHDFILPELKRTQRFLSIFLEFYNELNTLHPAHEEVEVRVSEMGVNFTRLRNEIGEHKKKIRERQMTHAEMNMQVEEEQKVLIDIKAQIDGAQEEKRSLKGKLEGAKQEQKEMEIQVKGEQVKKLEVENLLKEAKGQVISDEELRLIDRSEHLLKKSNDSLDELRCRRDQLKLEVQSRRKQFTVVEKNKMMLMEAEKMFEERDDILRQSEEVHNTTVADRERAQENRRQLERCLECVAAQEINNSQVDSTAAEAACASKQEVVQLKQSLEELHRRRGEDNVVLSEQHEEITAITEQIARVCHESERVNKEPVETLQTNEIMFDRYMDDLYEDIKNQVERRN